MGGSAFIGRVVSNRMQKTVVVSVSYVVWVPKYKVYEKRVARHMAHDEKQECVVGDLVKIQVTRKLSKHKSYRVADVLRRTPVYNPAAAQQAAEAADAQHTRSAVEAAEQRVQEARTRLVALQRMYEKELGTGGLGGAGLRHAAPAGSSHVDGAGESLASAPAEHAQVEGTQEPSPVMPPGGTAG